MEKQNKETKHIIAFIHCSYLGIKAEVVKQLKKQKIYN